MECQTQCPKKPRQHSFDQATKFVSAGDYDDAIPRLGYLGGFEDTTEANYDWLTEMRTKVTQLVSVILMEALALILKSSFCYFLTLYFCFYRSGGGFESSYLVPLMRMGVRATLNLQWLSLGGSNDTQQSETMATIINNYIDTVEYLILRVEMGDDDAPRP
ncbi:hypothetical protein BJV82DRAFT_575251 [Fennellomyces sp. T-0311]|nr:hypothetical protein BJV82DRAFT_575251 [Fennellomyces sp. T-0311]